MQFLFKAIVFLNVALLSNAGLPHAAPLDPKPASLLAPQPPPSPADYGFRYSVNDFKGNEHSHQQRRVGNAVTGQYKVLLPDGRLQTVTYIADENGYRAKVDYSPARPGEATTAGLGAPPIVQPLPPPPHPPLKPLPGFGLVPFGAQRAGNPSLRQTQDKSGNPERDDVTAEDVEQIDVFAPDAPIFQRSARRLGSLTSADSSAATGRAAVYSRGFHWSDNERAGRIRFNTARQSNRGTNTDYQLRNTWASRVAH